MRTKDDIVRIVQKLLKKTVENGCSFDEAAFAAERVKHFVERYQLSLVDIKSKTLNEDLIKKVLDSGRSVRNPGECCLAQAIADGCDVKLVVSYSPNYTYNFLGFTTDVEIATYLFESLRDGLSKRATLEGKMAGVQKAQLVRWRNNFLMGAAGEIRRRLQQAKEQRQRDFEVAAAAELTPEFKEAADIEAETPITAGVPLSKVSGETISPRALVEIKQPQVQNFVKSHYSKLSKSSGMKVRSNYSALDRGRQAGREIPIRQGVGVRRPDLVDG